MQLDPGAPIIVLSVENVGETDSRVVDMALDTGATYVMISWRVAEELGYDPAVSRRRVPITTASGIVVAPLINLKRIRALDNEINSVDAACLELPPGSRVRGLLGLSFIKHFNINIHFKSRVLKVMDP